MKDEKLKQFLREQGAPDEAQNEMQNPVDLPTIQQS